jgi:Bacterial dnaA protein helix-turn-helix
MTLLEGLHNPWRRPSPAPVDPQDLRCLLEMAAAVVFDVPLEKLRAGSRGGAQVAFARQSAMYLAHVALGLSYSAVGKLFGRDRTTAAHACQTVEDRRDDPETDIRLDLMEILCIDAFCNGALAGVLS